MKRSKALLYLANMDVRKTGADKTHFAEVGAELKDIGWEVRGLVPGYKPLNDDALPFAACYVPTLRKNWLGYLVAEMLKPVFLIQEIVRHRPVAIYARQELADGLVPLIAAAIGVPYIMEKNGAAARELERRGVAWPVRVLLGLSERVAAKTCVACVCVSESVGEYMQTEHRMPTAKVTVIENGANVDLFQPLPKRDVRRRLKVDPGAFVVCFVGSFAQWRQLDVLVKAVGRARHEVRQLHLYMVGDGEMLQEVKAEVRALKLEDAVTFTGRVPYEKAPEYMAAADLCYLAADAPGSPLKLFEYLAMGRPVLASDTPDIRGVLEGAGAGLLCDTSSVAVVSEALVKAAQDEELEEKGVRGRQYAERYGSWRRVAERVSHVIETAID